MVSIRQHNGATSKSVAAFLCLLLAFTALPALAEPAADKDAAVTVKNFYAGLTDVMKQGEQLGFSGRFKKLNVILNRTFNLPLMAKLSVGLGWNNATPAEQQQITSAFSDFSVATYANQFNRYDGETFTVTDEKSTLGGEIVETTITPKNGDSVALNYLMRQDEAGNWRIVDVFLNGAISQIATRRAEFSSVIKRDGIDALVNSLNEKSKPMGPG